MNRIITTFTDFGNREWKDKLHGGKADDKTPEDFDSDDIEIGTAVEREHSSNPDVATEIAMDHLIEDPDYYDKLISSGIADEEGAIELYDELKDDSDTEKAKHDIMDNMGEDEGEEVDIEDEDELGTDKADIEEDEDNEIINEYPEDIEEKINYRKMEKLVKNYNSFVNEAAEETVNQDVNQPGPERKVNKEFKYKFQLPYDKKVEQKLQDYNFTLYTPEGEKNADKNFIVIDIQNLTYSLVADVNPEIRTIDATKLKHIFENL